MCILTSILFIGGYLFIGSSLINLTLYLSGTNFIINSIINSPILEGLLYGLSLGIKSSMMVFVFI
ncbi:hypothetical protein GCM10028777_09270 [Angustibacter speluncae]